jgi:hypothetical protein
LIFGNNLPNFDQGSVFGRILPPLYGELKLLGEFGGGFIPRESGLRDIGSRGFSSSRGLSGDSNFSFKKMMSEVHDGMCGAHQSAYRMMGYQASRVLLADDIRGLL